jgi:hypothetical protein
VWVPDRFFSSASAAACRAAALATSHPLATSHRLKTMEFSQNQENLTESA